MSARGSVEKKRVSSFWRKNTPEERAKMQNERRKRKRKARSLKKEEERNKIVLALEDERARTAAKNERLLFLARKYYTKWQTLHRLERVRNFLNLFRGLNHDFILVRGLTWWAQREDSVNACFSSLCIYSVAINLPCYF